jgi:endoglucanase Acf2
MSERTANRPLAAFALGTAIPLLAAATVAAADSGAVSLGLGTYYTKPQSSLLSSTPVPPAAEYRYGDAAARAAPTNQWYSSVIFNRWSYPLMAHPLTYRATEAGFEIGTPDRHFTHMKTTQREVRYPHVAALVVSPVAFRPQDSRLSDYSDWLAQVRMAAGPAEALTVTVLHGSPFSYYEISPGDARIHMNGSPTMIIDPRNGGAIAAFSVAGHNYAIFAPSGASFDLAQSDDIVLHLPTGHGYFSIAGLPDGREATAREFAKYAYAFPVKTRAEWHYDQAKSVVTTTFTVETAAKEGEQHTTLMGLYPHQWAALPKPLPSTYTFDSVRGPLHIVAGNSFSVERTYHGIMPEWAGLEDPAHRSMVDGLITGDASKSESMYNKNYSYGTYWVGIGLGAASQLLGAAEAEGRSSQRDHMLSSIRNRLESWFDGRHSTYFMQDARDGTFVGYPEEYDSISHMNDHHFHYGYFINAAAQVALRDPQWASEAKWGGMTGKVIADIATDERGRADFPYLRNFDAYEGHSWASGDGNSEDGSNQESSSEAVNAWAGLILYGEATGNVRLRDLGIYLYTTEVSAIQTYWYDIRHEVLAKDYDKPFASMIFGDKYMYNTWWTVEPHQIFCINMLPLTGASMYLGASPEKVHDVMAALPDAEKDYADNGVKDGNPKDMWQDILASYTALENPDAGFARWNKSGNGNAGETRAHTLFWLLSLKEMGTPDMSVTADTPLYSVFRRADGTRTLLAYNAHDTPQRVTFSNGAAFDVPPHAVTRAHTP